MSALTRLKDGSYAGFFHDDGRFFRATAAPGPPRFRVFRTVSRDGGITWGAPEEILSDPDLQWCEPGVLRSPDGSELAMLLREESRKRNSYVSFSRDEGATWSAPRELPAALTGDRHVAVYAPDGRLAVTFRDMARNSPTRGDWVLWVGQYADLRSGGEGQYRVRLADNVASTDCCYAGLERLADGTLVTTTYGRWLANQPPYILTVRLHLEELDRLARTP